MVFPVRVCLGERRTNEHFFFLTPKYRLGRKKGGIDISKRFSEIVQNIGLSSHRIVRDTLSTNISIRQRKSSFYMYTDILHTERVYSVLTPVYIYICIYVYIYTRNICNMYNNRKYAQRLAYDALYIRLSEISESSYSWSDKPRVYAYTYVCMRDNHVRSREICMYGARNESENSKERGARTFFDK